MPTTDPAVIAVVHTKGGAGKTTTAVHVAHALHERGLAVLAVDADPQQSLWQWHELAPFPFPAVCLPSERLHREVAGFAGHRYDAVLIDTPGTAHGRSITLSALRAATHALVPVAPTGIEVRELAAVRRLIDDATEVRPGEAPPGLGLLLVKVRAGAASTAAFREVLADDGWPVLRPHVAMLERFGQAFGMPVRDAHRSAYADAAAELLGLDRVARHTAAGAA